MTKETNPFNESELMRVFQNSNFKILEGIVDRERSTLLFEEAFPQPEEPHRWAIKMVVQGNYLRLETEKKPVKIN